MEFATTYNLIQYNAVSNKGTSVYFALTEKEINDCRE